MLASKAPPTCKADSCLQLLIQARVEASAVKRPAFCLRCNKLVATPTDLCQLSLSFPLLHILSGKGAARAADEKSAVR
jgi:hypothetical protein